MNLAEAIKKCSMEAWEAQVPCDVVFGIVTEEEPVGIKVGDIKLPEEIIYVPQHLTYKEERISLGIYERTIVIREGLKKGDCVALVRKRGGEGYVVTGKIEEG